MTKVRAISCQAARAAARNNPLADYGYEYDHRGMRWYVIFYG